MAGLEVTRDALLRGRLPLYQPRVGYRTNVDSLWLAAFSRGKRRAIRAIDLGAGVGAVGLATLVMGVAERVTLIDIDPDLIELAERNCEGFAADARIVDLEARLPSELTAQFDLVVANPPYGDPRDVTSPDPKRARARTLGENTLPGFVRAARAALGAKGRACFVYSVRDLARLLELLTEVGLEPKRMRLVHPRASEPARVALVEAKPARPGGLRVEAPLIAMDERGEWTAEAREILEG
ncbi:MAG: tRNA1(Val) (adenine(37)-N6)-methyltransferase [Polyangiales bacterium]